MMGYYLTLYLAAFSTFLLLDMIWLGLVARSFYQQHIGFLMASSPNWPAAIIFYLLFIAGLLVFVVIPGLKEDSFKAALLRAVMFGLITYGTYDLTNLATVSNWPVIVTIVDMIWGILLSVTVCAVSFSVGKRLK